MTRLGQLEESIEEFITPQTLPGCQGEDAEPASELAMRASTPTSRVLGAGVRAHQPVSHQPSSGSSARTLFREELREMRTRMAALEKAVEGHRRRHDERQAKRTCAVPGCVIA